MAKIRSNLFKKPQNELEFSNNRKKSEKADLQDQMSINCPSCKKLLSFSELADYYHVCKKCGFHFRLNARQRIHMLIDEENFYEMDKDLTSKNILDFPEYEHKLKNAKLSSSENEAVITGYGDIDGMQCVIFVMDSYFMMGSMGSIVGEKITRAFEYATSHSLPVIGYTVSGGARMQEGIFSLMQMAKTSAAVKRHSDAGNLYIAVLTDPTSGGVTASFAMEADITIAEPKALICFTGPRVIEQTIRHKLPSGFQRAEFLLDKGFVDVILDRRQHREFLHKLLMMHSKGEA